MRALLAAVVVLAAIGSARAASQAEVDATFDRGNKAYLHGDYQGAIDAYEQVLAAGVVHEDLHYNLANAYFKAGRLGPAILHYEQALELDPSQEDVTANLKLARDTASTRFQDRVVGAEKDPLWMRVLAPFTLSGLTLAFLGLYVALFALALVVYLLPSGFLRVGAAVVMVFVLLATVAAGGLLGGRWYLARRVERGVLLPDEVAVKEGPDPTAQTSFLVHAGLKVRVMAHDQDFCRVRLVNGLEGWVRDRDVGRL